MPKIYQFHLKTIVSAYIKNILLSQDGLEGYIQNTKYERL